MVPWRPASHMEHPFAIDPIVVAEAGVSLVASWPGNIEYSPGSQCNLPQS